MTGPRVAVVGAGIAGLAAALALADAGLEVVVFDADSRPGGKLRTTPFAGLPGVDEGADSFLARVPEGRDLAARVGLDDRLTSPAGGTASVAWRHRLHPLPGGLVLGVPSGFAGVARSRLLSIRGKARAALDLVRPSTPADHDSLGRWVRDRFGGEVADLLVDPLVGSINAGGIDQLSLVASTPQLVPATRSRSALLAMRSTPKPGAGPVFHAPLGGMESLAAATAEATTSLKFSLAQALLTPLTMISDYQIGKLQEELDEITAVMEAEEKAYMNANFEHIKAADRNEALLQAMERFDAALAALESCAASCPDVGMRAPPLDIPVASFRAGPDGKPSEGTAIPWFEKAIGAYVAEASAALDDFVEASAFDRPSVELKPAKTAFGVNERIEIAYSGPACLLRGGFVVFDAGRSQSTRPEGGVVSFAGHDKPGRYAYRFVSKRLGVPLTADVLVGEPPGAKAPTRDGGKGQLDWRTVGPFTATCGGGAEGSYTFDIAPRWKAERGEFAIFWFSGAGNEDDFFRMPGCRWKYLDQTVKSVRITFDDGSVSTSMDGASSHQAFPAGATRVTRIELAVTPAYKQSFQVVWDF